jgi:hypothetical protein
VIVVSDTSPISNLAIASQISLLQAIFQRMDDLMAQAGFYIVRWGNKLQSSATALSD